MGSFEPGQRVSQSGVYRVDHESHRLMHEVTLKAGEIFPCCKQCGRKVRFKLLHPVRDELVLPFRTGSILEECAGLANAQGQAG